MKIIFDLKNVIINDQWSKLPSFTSITNVFRTNNDNPTINDA